MNNRIRLNVIAGAIAALASASAQAIIVTSSNSGVTSFSELIVVAYDNTKVGTGVGLTYVRGLDVQMNAFLPNPAQVEPFAANATVAGQFAGGTRTPESGATYSNAPIVGDLKWGAFTAAVGDLGNIRWGIVGRKAGTTAIGGQYPATVYTGTAAPTNNAQIQTMSAAFNTLMNAANSAGCGTAADSCVTEIDVGSNLGAAITYNGVGMLADTLSFTLAFKNTTTGSAGLAPALVPFCNSFDCADWTINGQTGEVIYSLAAKPIDPPTGVIPVPAAGWLMLTGIAGLAGLSRRKRSAA